MYSRFLAAGLLLGCVGCFDGLLIKPVNTQAPLAEKTVRPAEHALTFLSLIHISEPTSPRLL